MEVFHGEYSFGIGFFAFLMHTLCIACPKYEGTRRLKHAWIHIMKTQYKHWWHAPTLHFYNELFRLWCRLIGFNLKTSKKLVSARTAFLSNLTGCRKQKQLKYRMWILLKKNSKISHQHALEREISGPSSNISSLISTQYFLYFMIGRGIHIFYELIIAGGNNNSSGGGGGGGGGSLASNLLYLNP